MTQSFIVYDTRPPSLFPVWIPCLLLPVGDSRAPTMRRTPDIAYSDVPYTVLKLTHLSNIHPAPVLSYFDLVVRTDLDPLAIHFKDGWLSRGDDPFANPLAMMGPYRDLHLILPVIDDFKEATGLISVVFRGSGARLVGKWRPLRELYLDLSKGQEWAEQPYDSKHAVPSPPCQAHSVFSLRVSEADVVCVVSGPQRRLPLYFTPSQSPLPLTLSHNIHLESSLD